MKSREQLLSLADELHICDPTYLKDQGFFSVEQPLLEELKARIVDEGYFELPPVGWGLPVDAMARVVRTLREQGIPVVFSFAYDEFWLIFYRLHAIIQKNLGEYLKLPDFWVWHVDPKKDESGWSPHRDRAD